MSRRKVRGLTRTGRQVSEDPDLDNLLSNLSPEEMEELEKEVLVIPDQDPNEGIVIEQPATNAVRDRDAKLDSRERPGKLSQREQSIEGEPKKESRKQEYLRKMGLSQEGKEGGGIRRQSSISTERENKMVERNNKGPDCTKEDRASLSSRYRREESKEKDVKETPRESFKRVESSNTDVKDTTRDRFGRGESRDIVEKEDAKERDKNEDSKLKEKRDNRLSTSNKTKEMISKLQEKKEKEEIKEKERKEESRKRGENKTRGLVSKLVEKQSHIEESKPEDKKSRVEEKDKPNKDNGSEKEDPKEKSTPSKPKVEEEEDEDSSMFDDLIEQVRSNDPTMTELNVNNSEVIKAKTLIQFAEALNKNTHIKTFALANCRADDHVAYAIAGTLRSNTSITSINLDSNLLTPKGIMSLIQALQKNTTLTELRFHNQRHICGGKTEMEMTKILKDNTTLLKLGYGFELAGPRMTMTNILSRNMDKQRQRRLQEQKLAQANGEKKGALEVPKTAGGFLRGSPKASPTPSPHPSPMPSPKLTPKRGRGGGPPPPPPPGGPPPPPPPMLDIDSLRNSLTPASQRKMDDKANKAGFNSRDQLLDSIRNANMKKLKKVAVPKLLQ
ncbi:unnamed protein product [Oncorhynchus mykiss]|uniref:Leiomodin-1 n=1 Tax=Oncorhynchus mykiss TaxID=8022 RepID=A0A060XNW4_ONCMY|nr:unnamed protein product [Oncorhynchus mykiss]